MPEGDTIYRTARALQKVIGGKVVTGFETGLAKLAQNVRGSCASARLW